VVKEQLGLREMVIESYKGISMVINTTGRGNNQKGGAPSRVPGKRKHDGKGHIKKNTKKGETVLGAEWGGTKKKKSSYGRLGRGGEKR